MKPSKQAKVSQLIATFRLRRFEISSHKYFLKITQERDRNIRAAYDERFHPEREMPYSRVGNMPERRGDFNRPEEDYHRDFDYDSPRYYPNGGPRNYQGDDHRGGYHENSQFGNVRRNGPPSRRDEGYSYFRGARDDSHAGRQMEFRANSRAGPPPNVRAQGFCPAPRSLSTVVPEVADDTLMQAILNLDRGEDRDHFRRKGSFPPQRDRSPVKRDVPHSPHSRSGSSVSSRGYSPEKRKSYSLQKLQKSSTCSPQPRPSPSRPQVVNGKERAPSQPLTVSRDWSPQSSASTSKVSVDKVSRPLEPPLPDPLREVEETLEGPVSTLCTMPETRTQFEEIPCLDGEQEDLQDAQGTAKDDLQERRSKAITAKAQEIEQVFRQDCETFGMVVKMLVAKDPSLEGQLQTPLRENLAEIQQRCLEDLRHFISELDEVLQPETSG